MTRSTAVARVALSAVFTLGPGGGIVSRVWRYSLLGGGSFVLGLVVGGVAAAGAFVFAV